MEGDYNVLSEFTEDLVRQAFTEMQALIAAHRSIIRPGAKTTIKNERRAKATDRKVVEALAFLRAKACPKRVSVFFTILHV